MAKKNKMMLVDANTHKMAKDLADMRGMTLMGFIKLIVQEQGVIEALKHKKESE